MTAALAGLALLAAALLPLRGPELQKARWLLGGLGALALLPAAGDPAARPFVLLAAGAAFLAAPLPLVLAAGGAVLVALQPPGGAPVTAAVGGLAVAAVAAGVGARGRSRRDDTSMIAGAILVLILLATNRGTLLSWTLAVSTESGPAVVSGAGLVLGLALLNALAGVLAIAAVRLAPEGEAARPFGLAALRVSLGAGLVGVLVSVGRAVFMEGVTEAGARTLALLVVGVGMLGIALLAPEGSDAEGEAPMRSPDALTRAAVALAILGAVAAGLEGWVRDGTYTTRLTAASAATALLGLLALEGGIPLPSARRALFLLALAGVILL